ncbi:hypothetical protein L7F22_047580 [Adiantum nelumboides]|nr:hypothetical protein [Adiantum nelumboides]
MNVVMDGIEEHKVDVDMQDKNGLKPMKKRAMRNCHGKMTLVKLRSQMSKNRSKERTISKKKRRKMEGSWRETGPRQMKMRLPLVVGQQPVALPLAMETRPYAR